MALNPESAMAVRPSSSDQPYSFLDLPFEIRTMIYKELFVVQKLLCNYDEGTPQRLYATSIFILHVLAAKVKADGDQQT